MPKNTPEAIIDTPYVTSRRTGGSTSTSSGARTFLALSDTPSSYAGSGEYLVKVAATEDGLEFVLGSGGAVDSVNGQTGIVVLDTGDIAESGNLYFTDERAQDAVGTIFVDSSSIDFTYSDGTPSITAVVIDEYIQDLAGAMWSGNTETGVTVTYQDSDGTLDIALDDEYVQDLIGTAITGGTQTAITVTYTDASGVYNFVLDAELVAIAGLTSAADKGIYFTGSGSAGTYDLTSTARSLLDDSSTSAMRTTLGLVIGTNVQAFDATLTSIALLGTAADKIAYTTGVDTWAETALTSFGRSLIDDAAASNARTTLGLVIGTDVQAQDATLLSIAALGTAADKMAYTTGVDTWAEAALTSFGRSLIDDADAATARATLGITGTVAYTQEEIEDFVGAMVSGNTETGITVTYDDSGGKLNFVVAAQAHSALTGLTSGDDHTQYVLLLGRAGGQTIIGGTASGNSLTVQSSSNATKGKVIFGAAGTTAYDEVNDRLGIGANDPIAAFEVATTGTASTRGMVNAQHNTGAQAALSYFRKSRGTRASPAIVATGDFVGVFYAQVYDGGAYITPASFGFKVNGTPGSGSVNTDIIFAAGASNDTSLTNEVFRVFGAGAVSVNGASGAAALDVLQPTLGSSVLRLASTATNDDPLEDTVQDRVTTTNATVTTLHTFTVPTSTTYAISANVICRRTGGASGAAEDGAFYIVNGVFKNTAGTVTSFGVTTTVIGEAQAGWDATIDVTGATARMRVTGSASNNITWHMTARVYPVST